MILLLLLLVACAIGIIVFAIYSYKRHFNVLPPGPPDHFILGNLKYWEGNNPLFVLSKLCWKFGKNGMMRFRFPFYRPIVVIYKPEILAELYEKYGDDMNDRDLTNLSVAEFTGYGKDILMSSGEYWRIARKLFVQGVGSSVGRSIPIIELHLNKAIDSIRESEGNVVEIRNILSIQTFSVIADIAAGRTPIDHAIIKEFIEISETLSGYLTSQNLRNLIPGYRFYPFDDTFRKLVKRRNEILQNVIEEHKRTLDREHPKDFLDNILIDAENEEHIPISLVHILMDTFVGGTDTSSNTIEFMIGYLVNNPHIQKKSTKSSTLS
jgi:cytochrome P450